MNHSTTWHNGYAYALPPIGFRVGYSFGDYLVVLLVLGYLNMMSLRTSELPRYTLANLGLFRLYYPSRSFRICFCRYIGGTC